MSRAIGIDKGHALSLMGSVDVLFVTRIHSMVKAHNCCPRFGALLDANRSGIARGIPLVSIDINETATALSYAFLCVCYAFDRIEISSHRERSA